MTTSEALSLIQTIALVATLLVVGWYTIETHHLRKQTVRQNNLSLRPVVVPSLEVDGLFLKNVGNGCALNVTVSAVATEPNFAFDFEHMYYLASGEKNNAFITVKHNGQEQRNMMWHHWERLTSIAIHFQDVEGTKYRVPATADLRMGKAYPGEPNRPTFVIGPIKTL